VFLSWVFVPYDLITANFLEINVFSTAFLRACTLNNLTICSRSFHSGDGLNNENVEKIGQLLFLTHKVFAIRLPYIEVTFRKNECYTLHQSYFSNKRTLYAISKFNFEKKNAICTLYQSYFSK